MRQKVQPALRELIGVAEERNLALLEMEADGLSLGVRRVAPGLPDTRTSDSPGMYRAHADPHAASRPTLSGGAGDGRHAVEAEGRMLPVLSSLVGIFRVARAPAGKPVVRAGDRVEEGQVLAHVESMRLMNEVKAPQAGRLAEVLVEEGHPVEYGQALMVLDIA